MAITTVGSLYVGGGGAVTISPTKIGNVMVIFFKCSATTTPSAVSGGGVTTWNLLSNFVDGIGLGAQIWWGIITSPGSNLTATYTFGNPGSAYSSAQEFSGGSGTWSAGPNGGGNYSSGSATGSFPSVTDSIGGNLWLGSWGGQMTMTSLSQSCTFTTYSTYSAACWNLSTPVTALNPAWSTTGNVGSYYQVQVAAVLRFTPQSSGFLSFM